MNKSNFVDKKNNIEYICEQKLVIRVLENINNISIKYRILFILLKTKSYRTAIIYFKLCNIFLGLYKNKDKGELRDE